MQEKEIHGSIGRTFIIKSQCYDKTSPIELYTLSLTKDYQNVEIVKK